MPTCRLWLSRFWMYFPRYLFNTLATIPSNILPMFCSFFFPVYEGLIFLSHYPQGAITSVIVFAPLYMREACISLSHHYLSITAFGIASRSEALSQFFQYNKLNRLCEVFAVLHLRQSLQHKNTISQFIIYVTSTI